MSEHHTENDGNGNGIVESALPGEAYAALAVA